MGRINLKVEDWPEASQLCGSGVRVVRWGRFVRGFNPYRIVPPISVSVIDFEPSFSHWLLLAYYCVLPLVRLSQRYKFSFLCQYIQVYTYTIYECLWAWQLTAILDENCPRDIDKISGTIVFVRWLHPTVAMPLSKSFDSNGFLSEKFIDTSRKKNGIQGLEARPIFFPNFSIFLCAEKTFETWIEMRCGWKFTDHKAHRIVKIYISIKMYVYAGLHMCVYLANARLQWVGSEFSPRIWICLHIAPLLSYPVAGKFQEISRSSEIRTRARLEHNLTSCTHTPMHIYLYGCTSTHFGECY